MRRRGVRAGQPIAGMPGGFDEQFAQPDALLPTL
jgi:hypothetical protein